MGVESSFASVDDERESEPRTRDAIASSSLGTSSSWRARAMPWTSTVVTVVASVGAAALAGAATLAIRRGVGGGGGANGDDAWRMTRVRSMASLGQRTERHVFEGKGDDVNAASDHGFVSTERQRAFERRAWSWDQTFSCDDFQVTEDEFEAMNVDEGRKALWRNSTFSFQYWRTPRSRHLDLLNVDAGW